MPTSSWRDVTPRAFLKAVAVLFVSWWISLASATASDVSAYKVTAGDVLAVSVYGDNGLTGAFPVSVNGTIGYPILGNVAVADKTTETISQEIAAALSTHLANLSVAVAVKEYAPIFVVGDVQKPGKYEYRPGMIALELFALSGGLREATTQTDMSGVELVSTQRDYEDMSLQLLSDDVKRERFEAELNDTPFIYRPGDLGPLRDPAAVKQIVETEDSLFKLRLSAMQDEIANMETQRQNYIAEIDTLQKTGALRNQQFDLLSLDVEASQELVAKGAASQSALRDRKRELLAMNQQLLEFGSFLARAQQNKNEIERRMLEIKTKRHNDAANELRDIGLDMIRLKKKMAFSLQAMAEIGAAARRVTSLQNTIKTEFSVVRRTNGEFKEDVVDEHTQLQAGDVMRVNLVPSGVHAAKDTASLN